MLKPAEAYADVLREGRWFGSLIPEVQAWLLGHGVVREFAPEQALFRAGDKAIGLFAVLEGAIRITSTPLARREVVLARMEPPSWFGEVWVFDGAPRTHNAIADETSVVLYVPNSYLDAFLAERPTFWRDLGNLMATKLRLAFSIIDEAAVVPLIVRLARRLLIMAEAHGQLEDAKQRTFTVRQDQLASMLAVSRQTMNHVLKDLETNGVVKLAYGQLEITDVAALRRAAQIGASILPPKG